MRPIFGCAVLTQALTFDDPVAMAAQHGHGRLLHASKQFAENLHGRFAHSHVYLRCFIYESMHSSYQTSATMTECDYKKSENARHLILAELRCYMTGSVVTSCRFPVSWHGNSRQASGGDRLRVHPENYAPISATNLWLPRP